jgi:NADPH:quinone reductase-like Zn-dependent oxidoreductase
MISIVVREPRALEVESANVPEPKPDEVVVKVRRASTAASSRKQRLGWQRDA